MGKSTLASALALMTLFSLRCSYFLRNEYVYKPKENIVAPRGYNITYPNEMDSFLLNFPTEIPRASKVDRYLTPGAKYCLVHIRQAHLVEDTPDKFKKQVEDVQEDIYQILAYLIQHNDLNQVYLEGGTRQVWTDSLNMLIDMTREFNTDYREEKRKVSELETKIKDIQGGKLIPQELSDRWPNIMNRYLCDLREELNQRKYYLKFLKEVKENGEEQFKDVCKYDAAIKAAIEHGIKIMAAEDGLTDNRDNLEQREEVLLQIIARQNNPLAVCIYGGAHAWGGNRSFGKPYSLVGRSSLKDNIAEWNIKYPEKKFSLIEIIPMSYSR